MTADPKVRPPSKFAAALYYVSFLFMASGAVNYGVTAYFWAVPFAYYALLYAARNFQTPGHLLGVVVFIALGVVFNETIDTNPLVFPILADGYLQEVRPAAATPGVASVEVLGERVRVTQVQVDHPDFETKLTLIGSDGRRYQLDSREQLFYSMSQSGSQWKRSEFGFRPSGPVESPIFKHASVLMLYPWLPLGAYAEMKDALKRVAP